uniref:Uncharacterized protein n=1 Tax=Noctiluca scintillans TaxID=2966 RepID=A0A7S1F7T8_NOCSC
MEDHATEVEAMERDFMERIIRALLRCLRDDAPAVLIRGVSSCMSQSGLASVERACQSPQVIVGGGDQRVHFELSALESLSAWDLRLSVRKFGFKTCIIIPTVDGELCDVDPMPVICSDSSSLVKGCTVRFTLSLFGSELLVDVLQLQNELKVVDDEGKQLVSPRGTLQLKRSWQSKGRFLVRLGGSCLGACARGCVEGLIVALGQVVVMLGLPLLKTKFIAKRWKRKSG